jgi:hypothetical protein
MFMGLPYATLPNTENSWFEVGLDLEYFPNHQSSTKVVDTPTEAHSSPLSVLRYINDEANSLWKLRKDDSNSKE